LTIKQSVTEMFSAVLLLLLIVVLVINLLLLLRLRASDGLEIRLRDDLRALASQTDQRGEWLRNSLTDTQREQQRQLESIHRLIDQRLEQMRHTVDEKLQTTLESRLGESFRLVSERLEQVHKGLGEMQNLASGVGDLKRVLSNVTTRGAWGEVQLENLLAQILAPDQYDRNVSTTGTAERVEFAIKMPEGVWLPVDAKFPMDAYQRLAAASELGNADAVEAAARELE